MGLFKKKKVETVVDAPVVATTIGNKDVKYTPVPPVPEKATPTMEEFCMSREFDVEYRMQLLAMLTDLITLNQALMQKVDAILLEAKK